MDTRTTENSHAIMDEAFIEKKQSNWAPTPFAQIEAAARDAALRLNPASPVLRIPSYNGYTMHIPDSFNAEEKAGAFRALEEQPTHKMLKIHGGSISVSEAKKIASIPNLEQIELIRTTINNKAVKALTNINPGQQRAVCIHTSNTFAIYGNLKPEDISRLCKLLQTKPHFTQLEIYNSNFNDVDAHLLAKNTTLNTLKIHHCQITDIGVAILATNLTITSFEVTNNPYVSETWQTTLLQQSFINRIRPCLSFPEPTAMDSEMDTSTEKEPGNYFMNKVILPTQISDNQWIRLCQSLEKKPHIDHLCIYNSKFSDGYFQLLLLNTTLKKITLDHCVMPDSAAIILAANQTITTFKIVNCTPLSPFWKQALEKQGALNLARQTLRAEELKATEQQALQSQPPAVLPEPFAAEFSEIIIHSPGLPQIGNEEDDIFLPIEKNITKHLPKKTKRDAFFTTEEEAAANPPEVNAKIAKKVTQ